MFYDIYGFLSIAVLVCIFFAYFFLKKRDKKDLIYAVYFVVVLIIGTVLYTFAFIHGKDQIAFSLFFVILKSISFSLASFVGNFNNSAAVSLARESQIFHAAYIIHFFAASLLTFLIVIKLFGKNVVNAVRVLRISFGKKYIVIGSDGQAWIFLKNLTDKQKKKTIIILQPEQKLQKSDLIDMGFAVVIIKEEEKINADKKDICENLYSALHKAGAMRCKYNTTIISMSEKDETNLMTAKIITDFIDDIVKPVMENNHIMQLTDDQEEKASKLKIDACIMYSFLERAEHFLFIEKALGKVRFFNPYKIRALKFLWENPITKLIPVQWIDAKTARLKNSGVDGREKYKISNIFIGFGPTNKAILKSSIINNQLLNVDYNALVISQNASKQEKLFKNNSIGLFDTLENGKIIKRGAELKPNPDGNVYLESPSEQNNIVFKEADALSVELYDLVIKEIEGKPVPCDYATIIIALGENKLNIETALEIRQKLYESELAFGKDKDIEYQRVKIFVKIDGNTIFTDDKILNGSADKTNCKIEIFGSDEEILTEEYIINEKLDVLAKNIANRYEGSAETATAANEWNTCSQFRRDSNRYAAMAIKIKLNLLGLDLVKKDVPDSDYNGEYQTRYGIDASFNLRAARMKLLNEIKLARSDEINKKAAADNLPAWKRDDEIIDLVERQNDNFADTPRNNLARLEHQRWNAFHFANDWTKLPKDKIGAGRMGRQNEVAKQHACLTSFRGLMELREMQKDIEKAEIEANKEKQFIEAESLLAADTIRHDFNTMDFLLDLSDENIEKMRKAEGAPDKKFTGILTGSGFCIDKLK